MKNIILKECPFPLNKFGYIIHYQTKLGPSETKIVGGYL